MQQLRLERNPSSGRFSEAMRQAQQLPVIKNPKAKRWQQSNILKTLLLGLRGM